MFRYTTAFFGKVLVLAETHQNSIFPGTLAAVTAGLQLGEVTTLIAGETPATAAAQLSKVKGVSQVFIASGIHYEHGLPEEYAPLVASLVQLGGYTHVLAATSAFGKGIIPRAAALCDVMPISEVSEVKDESTFVRYMYAGGVVSTVRSTDPVKFATIRSTSFERAPLEGGNALQQEVEVTPVVGTSKWLEDASVNNDAPDIQTAATVIAGGRGLKSGENFKLLHNLAKPLHAAVGATRAAVDAGYCSNDLQIGQTGKTVAPNLYVGCGVSGAIQHVAGLKDAKVIAVINNDAEAPFFQVADYGLVEDLFVAVPKLTELVTKSRK
ncbi:electron-transfer-flavoprotein, alpha polypeptide, putative [Trypanosoma brucei gambiense DAL972]|uniref:Electron transfer flavoprotein subunit alpha n=1 Tax=Trypanosoma brucei gambiense (strain MHOM/CI/86/DAL972) TaxID=679716 RepID=D0A7V3_TRYB9|nr:electron-transfer-flavoprotein, alpha polypeptide, putative [Trypanosoma brucei gambiense DAL972]CBH17754.1 electron-transfer-flavoprotein, alpha polypeptide, putative [Trypanosoma brucei gambiense DAL972]|eukprot:XP_011780018.1 electron-transfer-flavoprotein, alpha polypeptide, putative [Trypanosoma brucei gambiense DAL972]